MFSAIANFFLWIPVFFGIGIAIYDLLNPTWIYNGGGFGVSILVIFIAVFRDQLLELAKKLQIFHPARFFRMLTSHLLKLVFYILLLPIFSQAILFIAGFTIIRRFFRFFRWILSPQIWQIIKPFIRKIFGLIPWKFFWKWGRNIYKIYVKGTWLGKGMSLASSQGVSTIRQPLFWVEKTFKKLWSKFKRFQIRMLRWSLKKLRNPKISFLKKILFIRQRKIKWNISLKMNLKSHPILWTGLCILLVSFGSLRMGMRHDLLGTKTLKYPIFRKEFSGIILKNEIKGNSQRLSLRPVKIGNWEESLPKKVRLTSKEINKDFRLGDKVLLKATVMPPSNPVAPNAFDFSRYAYYQGIAGVGYTDKNFKNKILVKSAVGPSVFESWREKLKLRLFEKSDSNTSRFVSTILLGERYALPEKSLEIFRKAGLSHLMSVSGFHLVSLAFIFFFMVRFLLVLIIPLSRKLDVKKISAIASLIFLTLFLFMSDARLPTQRAYIMTALAMIAILMNRSPFSLRILALSAIIILGISPEALFNPGFQMSFACAGALIGVYNKYTFFANWNGFFSKIVKFFSQTFLTSIIAFSATLPFVIYHFQSVSVIGIIANLVAIPFFSFVLLPLSSLFLIFPLNGIEKLLTKSYVFFEKIAIYFSEFSFGYFSFSQFSIWFLISAICGGLIFLIWNFRFKKTLISFFILLGVVSIFTHELPKILINKDATVLAFEENNKLVFATNWKKDSYASKQWMMIYGLDEKPKKTKLCYRKHPCEIIIKGKKITIIRRFTDVLKHIETACKKSDFIVVSALISVPKFCKNKIIDLSDTKKGYAEITIKPLL
ncbi:MAG: ComEC/Rec2 family competence protein [Alphaproteobacteria bacterium]|nr:MAG: hypothetical protein B6I23_02285 [Rickettsiaceae bacterium 4572_127]